MIARVGDAVLILLKGSVPFLSGRLGRARSLQQFPETIDALALYRLALVERIATTPGNLCSATNRYCNFIRLNAANWSELAEAGAKRLGELAGELGG